MNIQLRSVYVKLSYITIMFYQHLSYDFYVKSTTKLLLQFYIFFSFSCGAQGEFREVQVLHSDDYNATRVRYITLINHTGAQWYHN